MLLVVTSKPDTASMNILKNLLTLKDWKETGKFKGNPVYSWEDKIVVTIEEMHLYSDEIDVAVKNEVGVEVETVIYASKHRSQSETRTLTVHPIGNYGTADFGGKSRSLVPSSPHLMTETLRILNGKAKDLTEYKVSFETTHHGPYLNKPAFYIEIGSNEEAWKDVRAGKIIADTIVSLEKKEYPVAVGAGGGHYAPRITDIALKKKVSFGHIVPSYALKTVIEVGETMVRQMVEKSERAELVFVHRKGGKDEGVNKLEALLGKQSLRIVSEKDLENLM